MINDDCIYKLTGTCSVHNGINEDPFMSTNRTILKKRGDKMPFHKLDQLQEEDEHEEDDQ